MGYKYPAKVYYGGPYAPTTMHPNAPALATGAGGLIALLDAVLVDGFNVKSITSISIDANKIATVTCAAHGYNTDNNKVNRLEILGCTEVELNREWEIATIPSVNTFTIDMTAAGLASINATGTITCRIPPLGWTRPFGPAVANVVVYRSADPTSNKNYLRIDDSYTGGVAKVRYYESMTDMNTGLYPVPTAAQSVDGVSWAHFINAGAGANVTINILNNIQES